MTPVKKRYSFWINDTEVNGLRSIKEQEGISESEQIRQAIREWLAKKNVRVATAERKRGSTRKRS